MVEFWRFGGAEHQPNAATIEEGKVGSGKEQLQTQRVTVKCRGTRKVVNDDGNLADILDAKVRGSCAHGVALLESFS